MEDATTIGMGGELLSVGEFLSRPSNLGNETADVVVLAPAPSPCPHRCVSSSVPKGEAKEASWTPPGSPSPIGSSPSHSDAES